MASHSHTAPSVSSSTFPRCHPVTYNPIAPSAPLQVPRAEIDKLFDSFDPDGSGSIGYSELKKMLVVNKETKAKVDAVAAFKAKVAGSPAAKGATGSSSRRTSTKAR